MIATADNRDDLIAEMASDPHTTLQSIGDRFGFTRERARQIINRLVQEGRVSTRPVAQRKAEYLSVSAFMRAIGLNTFNISEFLPRLIADGVVHPSRDLEQYKTALIPVADVEPAKRAVDAMRQRCQVCRKLIRQDATMCTACHYSPKVQAERYRVRRAEMANGEWHPGTPLYRKIVKRLKRGGECSLGLSRASKASGLSLQQLTYLRWGKAVSVKDGQGLANNGKPRVLFSENEMRQIAAIRKSL